MGRQFQSDPRNSASDLQNVVLISQGHQFYKIPQRFCGGSADLPFVG